MAEVRKMHPRDLRRLGHRFRRVQRTVRLDIDFEPIKVRSLSDAGLPHREVRARHRIVNGIDPNRPDRESGVAGVVREQVLLRHHEAATAVHPHVQGEGSVFGQILLQGEEHQIRVDDAHGRVLRDPARRNGTRLVRRERELRIGLVLVHHQDETFQVLDDLMHVLGDAVDRLVLVLDTIGPKRPHGRARQRGQHDPPNRVSDRVAEPALQGLEEKRRPRRLLGPLALLHRLGKHEASQIHRHRHM